MSGYTENFASIEKAVAALYDDMQDVTQLLERISNLDQTLSTIRNTLKSSNGPIDVALASGLQTQVNNLKIRMEQLNQFLAQGHTLEQGIQFREGGTTYYNIGDLQKMYSKTLKANLALFAEKLATASIQTDVGVNLISEKLTNQIKGTIRSTQKGSGLLQTQISVFVDDNKDKGAKKGHWTSQFGSNLTDIKLTEQGAQISYNISQKQYSNLGQGSTKFHGLNTTIRRILLYLEGKGLITANGFWGIIRALAADNSPSQPLKEAFIRHTWVQSVLGEGEDLITDFLINGTLIPAMTVYNELNSHQDSISLTIGNYSPPKGDDDKAALRATEEQSTKYFLNYLSAKAVADRSFNLSFKLSNNLFK